MPREDLQWALHTLSEPWRRQMYVKYARYDEGFHPLAFASEKFRTAFFEIVKGFKENICPGVVDSYNDRLKITGFRTNQATMSEETVESPVPGIPARRKVTVDDPLAEELWDLWKRNRMDLRSSEVHRESLLMGDSFVIVWPDDEGRAAIWPQLATEFDVEYDPNNPGVILRATKAWWNQIEKRWYMNVYLIDRIEKYRVKDQSFDRTKATFPNTEGPWTLYQTVTNVHGRVPAFHFPNRLENRHGISELKDILEIQDGLNKSVIDMLIAMEYASFKQRYVIGMEVETDAETGEPVDQNVKNYGVDRLLGIPDPEAKVGQFDATDLGQFLRVQDKFWMSASRIKGIPLHYFYITTGDFPSGEAIKSAEGRFIKTLFDKQTAFGNQWEDVLKFCLQIEGEPPEDLVIDAVWQDATPRSEAELADTAVKKKAVGVPRSQILRELGYTEEEITRFLEESDAEALVKVQLQMEATRQTGGEEETEPTREQRRSRQGVEGG